MLLTAIVIGIFLLTVEIARGMTNAQIIRAVWPNDSENLAVRVARCESHLNSWAHNPSGATGLFQIVPGPKRPSQSALYNPWVNTREALHLYNAAHHSFWNDWRWSAGCWA